MSMINRNFRNSITSDVLSFYSLTVSAEENSVHNIRMRFTRKGNKYANILDHMIQTGKAKSGSTMRQVYKYLYTWMLHTEATNFDCPKFNKNCKYTVEYDNGELYVTNVTRNKRNPLMRYYPYSEEE